MTTMDEQGLQALRADVISRKNLPTIPVVLARIMQLTDSEGANARELIEIVEHDQALTGKILRLANSAFFGQSRRVATIPRAVLLLGFTTVRNLALGVKVWDALGKGIPRAHLQELWTHSVAVAVATKALSTRLRSGDPDQGFTAGLLHDVGRLVLAMRFTDDYWKAVGGAAEHDDIEAVESATFGVDHTEVGGWMLDSWNLPPGIVEAVRWHGATSRPGTPELLAVTNRLVAGTDLATGTLTPEATALLETLGGRGITPELWASVVSHLRESEVLALGRLDG
jgi:putative nucleotidyltransferase with HDIG domain